MSYLQRRSRSNRLRRMWPIRADYEFKAEFANDDAAPIADPLLCDVGELDVNDTANHLSVSGGELVCDGGESSHGDPGIWENDGLARVCGRALIFKKLSVVDTTLILYVGWDTNKASVLNSGLIISADLLSYYNGSTVRTIGSVSDGVEYDIICVLRDSGGLYIQDGNLLWVDAIKTTTPVYPAITGYSAAFTLDNLRVLDLRGAWAQDSGVCKVRVASPETVTPTLGSELVTNGDMEAVGGWGNYNSPSVNERSSEQAYNGTYSRKVTGGGGADGAFQLWSKAAGAWYLLTGYVYGSVPDASLRWQHEGITDVVGSGGSSAWAELSDVGFSNLVGQGSIYLFTQNIGSGYYDDISIKQISLASMLGNVSEAAPEGSFITAWPTEPEDGNVVGMVICLDDETNPQNGIWIYHDGTNLKVHKIVNGTYTALESNAAAWGNDKRLYLRKSGNIVKAFYGDEQPGSDLTVADVSVTNNTKFCWFTTNGSLKPSYAEMWPWEVSMPRGVD